MIKEFEKITGPKGVLKDKEDVYPYAYDTSPNSDELKLPLCVVFPKNVEEISEIAKMCSKRGISIIPRGAGTCHCGGCRVLDDKSIILHLSKMDKILNIDKENLTAQVQPNVVLGDFQKQVEDMGLFFPPDPSNLAVSTIGGAIALNSGGPRTFKYGNMKDYLINLTVVLANGEILETSSDIAKDVTGYNLTQLFAGSEGTLGIIAQATLKLIPRPEKRFLTLAYFDTIEDSAIAVNKIIEALLTPSVIDLLDKKTLETIEKFNPCNLLTNYEGTLLIETDGIGAELEQDCILKVLKEKTSAKEIVSAKTEAENENIWRARRSAFGSCAKLKPNVITEDVVVPRNKIPFLVKGIQEICARENLEVCIMGHAGDGNIHPNFVLDLEQEQEAFARAKDKLFALAIELGGTLSGEHGIGCEKKPYLTRALSPLALKYMGEIKKLFDPNNILNPNKGI